MIRLILSLANYGTKFETGIYEEQVKSGYRLPLHPFALRFFEHYRMAPGQLVPNGWRKLAGLIYLVQTSGYKLDVTNFMRVFFEIYEPLSDEQLEWAKIIPQKPIPAGLLIPPPPPAIPSVSSAETVPLEMASGSGKSQQGGFLGILQKAKGKRKEKQPSVELPPAPKKTRVTPPERSPRILDQVSRSSTFSMEFFLETRRSSRIKHTRPLPAPSLRLCIRMYASWSEMLSRFEMVRQVAAEEAQLKREIVKEAQEATHRAEQLSKQEEDHLAQIATLEKRLERVKRRAAEEVTKARDQGIRDFLDGNAGDEWLKKRTEDGLEIYELGFVKANEMFAERFPNIPLDDFVLLR
ncbi:hypothetical protein RJ640_001048 [Escallonia rubra]|uniref:Transposase (putative) gypsy type domain-containing protein n=1 Tax=Escallonia rubra TaxID=112253 RepID=A0AA88S736_9ASTE|nr:hypothetical protein RJ640_001048 [Escallonia rubra]